jgi:hypothetical protein
VKILLDEGVPIQILPAFRDHDITTVQREGWGSMKNGELIARADGSFDVFVTCDKNLKYQQNLKNRTIAILELSTNKRRIIEENLSRISMVISECKTGSFISVDFS